MVHWLIGRSGVGKTRRLLNELRDLAKQYENVFFLTPEQSSLALEKEIGKPDLKNRVQVVSFRRLCNVIFRRYGGIAGEYMTASREAALIFKVLLENRDSLRYYGRARASVGFVTGLRDAFTEFTRSGLTREGVLPLLEKLRDKKTKFEDLFLLYDAYRNALSEECRSAENDLAAALKLAEENRFFERTAVVIDGFFGFTGVQREMLRVIFRDCPNAWCALTLDPKKEDPIFESTRKELRVLQAIAAKEGAKTCVEPMNGPSERLDSAQLRWLERNFFTPRSQTPMPREGAIRLYRGRNIREELTLAALEISRAVREEGKKYGDFALIAGALDQYGPVAEQVFRQFGVPLFVDQKRSSAGTPLFLFIQRAVRIVSLGYRREDVLAFLKTGLCGEEPDRIAALENYCIRWDPTGESWTRDKGWTKNPAGLAPRTPETDAALKELNQMRERLRIPLLRFARAMEIGTGKAMAEGIFRLMEDFRVADQMTAAARGYAELSRHSGANAQSDLRTAREYASLYAVTADILDDIYRVIGDARVDPLDLADLIDLCAGENALKVAPPTVNAVQMGTVSLSRLGEVERLFVVGANQDLLPPPVSESGLIGDRERQIFAENGLACNATLEENARQAEARFYSVLFSARKQIAFFYSEFTVTGEKLFPSPYVRWLKETQELEETTAADLCLYEMACTREGARELMSRVPEWQAPILRELGETPRAKQKNDDPLTPAVVNALFEKQLQLSFSSINEYQKCPFRYFMHHTLGVKKVDPVSFDLPGIGTFVHAGMEEFIKTVIKEPHRAWGPEEIRDFSAVFSDEYLQEKLNDLDPTPRFLWLYRRMTDLLDLTARDTAEELNSGKFKPYGTELEIGVKLPLSGGRTAFLTGNADRVDTFSDENGTWIKIIDYKTGGKEFRFTDLTNRTDFQLPLYLFGMRESGLFERPLPAAACYFNALPPEFKDRCAPEELPEKLREAYRRCGVISDDPAVLGALDQEHFDLSDKKLLPRALLEEAVSYMQTIVTETAEEIYAGNVAVLPLIKDERKSPCRYCEYHTVCARRSCDPKREYNWDPEAWRKEAAQ